MPPPIKEFDHDDPNRPRSPEIFLDRSVIQAETLAELPEDSSVTDLIENASDVPEKISEENDKEKQMSSEDSDEDSDDDIVVTNEKITLSSMETNMTTLSALTNASPSTAGINLKRNNLLTLTNMPGLSAGSKVSKKIFCIITRYTTIMLNIKLFYIIIVIIIIVGMFLIFTK